MAVKPITPLPPRLWVLNVSGGRRLIYPSLVSINIADSFGIKSSWENLPTPWAKIWVRLSSPKFSLIFPKSSLIIFLIFASEDKISFNSFISFLVSFNSSSTFSLSRLASCCNFISNIASACLSDNLNFLIKFFLASSLSLDFLIVLIMASIFSKAITSPFNIWALASALSKSNCDLLLITSFLCFIYSSKIIFKFKTRGWIPSIKASIFTLKFSCKEVRLYKRFNTFFG